MTTPKQERSVPDFKPGDRVKHRDGGPQGAVGEIVRRVTPSVGAPFMYRVRWGNGHTNVVNGRSLYRVDS